MSFIAPNGLARCVGGTYSRQILHSACRIVTIGEPVGTGTVLLDGVTWSVGISQVDGLVIADIRAHMREALDGVLSLP